MAIQILFDSANNVKSPTMVLTYRSGKSIGAILPHNLHYSESLNACNEMSFDVYKDINGVECQYWSNIKDFRLVYCVEWDEYFEIYVEIDEADETIKHIQGRSLSEAELSQIKVYGLEVNTELDISREDYRPTIIYSSDEEISLIHKLLEKTPNFEIEHVDISIAKLQRTFTFDDKTVYDALQEVSEEVKCLIEFKSKKGSDGKIKRSISIYDLSSFCEECGHRNIDGDVCPKYEDQESAHATYKGKNINPGFGEDTSIFVSRKKLTDNITYSSDVDSVKNCFKLTAGDDLMTATVRNCSPSKSGYLWHFTQEMMSDMSSELRAIIGQYQAAYDQYNTQFKDGDIDYGTEWEGVLLRYNKVCNKYKPEYSCPNKFINYLDIMNTYYNTIDLELYLRSSMMPSVDLEDLTNKDQAETYISTISGSHTVYLQNITNLSEYSPKNAIESYLRTVVDPKFQIKLTQSSFDNNVWKGMLTLVSYSNDNDIGTKNIIVSFSNDKSGYTKQKLETSLAKTKAETPDIIELYSIGSDADEESQKFENFQTEIGKYGLVPLTRLRDAGQACLNILIEMGVGGDKANTLWFLKWQSENDDLYDSLYKPYYDRVTELNKEIKERQKEIDDVVGKFDTNGHLVEHGMMSYLEDIVSELQEKLDLEGYINTFGGLNATELLKELVSFRREDTYKNDNFISEGLDNAQVFSRALEFVAEADKDIRAAAVPIHTISSTLKNLLVMKEFKGIVDKFKVGNWIRAEIDSEIFKLRLIRYDIGFDDINNIQVEFSDVQSVKDSMADIQSILNQASSIAGNYSNIKIEVDNNKKAGEYIWEWVNDGLALTKMKIVDDAENQNIYWDENGFLCREYSPVMDAYEDKQLKIINKGLYLTDDNWQTTRAGIGNFIYYDPKASAETGKSVYKESYGVIADTLVGNLILTKELGIYNEGNSIQMDDDGLVITINKDNNTYNQNVFKIRKDTGETELDGNNNTVTKYDDLFYVDSDGDLCIKGKITANSLHLGTGADVDLGFDLNNYLLKSEADNKYVDSSGYTADKQSIWNAIDQINSNDGTGDLITQIGEFSKNAVFLAKPYGDIIQGYYYSGSFYEDDSHQKIISPTNNKYYLDKPTGQHYKYSNGMYNATSAPEGYTFAVSTDGLLTASNAVISGKIYASEGEFIGTVKSGLRDQFGNYNFYASSDGVNIGYLGNNEYAMRVDPSTGMITFHESVVIQFGGGSESGGNTPVTPPTTGGTTNNEDVALRQALGYDGRTMISGKYVISPYISGGYLYIGNDSGTKYAQISDGVLTAQGANIIGSINSGYNSSYKKYNFQVNDDGSVNIGLQTDGSYAMSVSADGNIVLGSGVTLSWGDLGGTPTIPSGGNSSGGGGLTENEVKNIISKNYINNLGVTAVAVKTNWVYAGEINASQITAGLIKGGSYTYNYFNANSTTGSVIDLDNGYVNFGGKLIYSNSGLTVTGQINATSLKIGTSQTTLDNYISNNSTVSNAASNASNALSTAQGAVSTANDASGAVSTLNSSVIKKDTAITGTASTTAPTGFDSSTGGYFYVDANGNLYARTGKIGCLSISSGGLGYRSGNVSYIFMSPPSGSTPGTSLFLGSKDNNFRVQHDGSITHCSSASVQGKVTSQSLEVTGGATVGSLTVNAAGTTTLSNISASHIDCGGMLSDGDISVKLLSSSSSTTGLTCDVYSSTTATSATNTRNMILSDKDGRIYIGCDSNNSYGLRTNIYTQVVDLGHTNATKDLYMSGKTIRIGYTASGTYATNSIVMNANSFTDNAGIGSKSDSRFKFDINSFASNHEIFFKSLKPCTFKYIDGTSNRTHFGFIAQELNEAIYAADLSTTDVAAFMTVDTEEYGERHYIRYQEIVALNTHMIQKCLKEIDSLKAENESLKLHLQEIKQSI